MIESLRLIYFFLRWFQVWRRVSIKVCLRVLMSVQHLLFSIAKLIECLLKIWVYLLVVIHIGCCSSIRWLRKLHKDFVLKLFLIALLVSFLFFFKALSNLISYIKSLFKLFVGSSKNACKIHCIKWEKKKCLMCEKLCLELIGWGF